MGSPSPLFLLLLFLIWIYLLPWGKKRDIWLLTLLITLCPIKLPSLKAFVSAISSTKIPEEALNHPTTSTGEESYNRRNGGSKEERHLGTGHRYQEANVRLAAGGYIPWNTKRMALSRVLVLWRKVSHKPMAKKSAHRGLGITHLTDDIEDLPIIQL